MGWEESRLASWIVTLISNFVRAKRLGSVLGPDGPIRFGPGLIRLPDVSFFSSGRLPAGKFSNSAILPVAPNLAIEVLSRSNTAREMRQKLKEYFKAGVELVWFVDLRARTVEVFTAVDRSELLDVADTLTGGKVLRGFKVAVRELFDVCDQ